jgi:hypothetical protein
MRIGMHFIRIPIPKHHFQQICIRNQCLRMTHSCRNKWSQIVSYSNQCSAQEKKIKKLKNCQKEQHKYTVPAESIEWFIEGQVFSLSYYFAPPHPLPLSRRQIVSLSQFSCVSPVEISDGREVEGGGWGAKSYDSEKAWSSLNHSILCVLVMTDLSFPKLNLLILSYESGSGPLSHNLI